MAKIYPHADNIRELDNQMDDICREINQCLGTSSSAVGIHEGFWWAPNFERAGTGRTTYQAYFKNKQALSDPTKEGLVAKLQDLLNEIYSSPDGMDQTWVSERFLGELVARNGLKNVVQSSADSDLKEFKDLLLKLDKEGRRYEDENDPLSQLGLGSEKFPRETREIIKEMVFIIWDNPEFSTLVPDRLKDFFSAYIIKW